MLIKVIIKLSHNYYNTFILKYSINIIERNKQEVILKLTNDLRTNRERRIKNERHHKFARRICS